MDERLLPKHEKLTDSAQNKVLEKKGGRAQKSSPFFLLIIMTRPMPQPVAIFFSLYFN